MAIEDEAPSRRWIWILLALVGLGLGSFGVWRAVESMRPQGTDEQQLRAMLNNGAAAAMRKDQRTLFRYLSDHYRDSYGLSDTSLRYEISSYLREHSSIQVSIPESSVSVTVDPGEQTGTVSFHVSLRAVPRESASGEPVASELDITLKVAREPVYYLLVFPGSEWKITSADGYVPSL